jgi:hypothetical protein
LISSNEIENISKEHKPNGKEQTQQRKKNSLLSAVGCTHLGDKRKYSFYFVNAQKAYGRTYPGDEAPLASTKENVTKKPTKNKNMVGCLNLSILLHIPNVQRNGLRCHPSFLSTLSTT